MLSIKVVGDDVVMAKLDAMPNAVHQALLRKVTVLAFALLAKVKGKLSGEVLNVRSGLLRDSAFQEVQDSGTSVYGRVAEPGAVPYAAIQEFGGVTPAHVIEARNAQALAWVAGGKTMFARRVNHPGSRIPERSYLRSALDEMHDEIVAGLREAVAEGTAGLRG